MNEFFNMVDKKIKAINESFIFQSHYNYSRNGVSRFSFLLDDINKETSEGTNISKDILIFKVCVPTSIDKKSFVDYHCPLSECASTYEQSSKCIVDESIKVQNVLVTKDLTGGSATHLLK